MKRTFKETCIRLVILLVGLSIAHLGVTLFLLAGLGADPFNVLIQGLNKLFCSATGWNWFTHGYTHVSICFLIMLILLFVDRKYVKLGTLVCMAFGGPIIDFFTWLLKNLVNETSPMAVRILLVILGCIILSFGMTIVMESDAGTGPNDLVAISISDKLHTPFGITRIVTDIVFIGIGWLLGGIFGVGTLVCACLVGAVAERFLPLNRKWIQKTVQKMQ